VPGETTTGFAKLPIGDTIAGAAGAPLSALLQFPPQSNACPHSGLQTTHSLQATVLVQLNTLSHKIEQVQLSVVLPQF
ncbi:MAG: hypothetical protein L6300_07515, partial [Syntrophaceae bacterium]|nr:hypothetical protein [Syntrophaceae bacterium]